MELEQNFTELTAVLVEKLEDQKVSTLVRKSLQPYKELMSYYRCAMMEVETKFNVLNEELSMQYDRNPIESIRTRLKSPDSIREKDDSTGLSLDSG